MSPKKLFLTILGTGSLCASASARVSPSLSLPVGPTSLDSPAWVQAVGSILTLIAILSIAVWEALSRRSERKQDQAAEKSRRSQEVTYARREYAKFLNFVQEEIETAREKLIYYGDFTEDPNTSPDGTKSDSRPEAYIKIVYEGVESQVMKRLRRIAALPISYWPDPKVASLFFGGLELFEIDFKTVKEPAKVPIGSSDEDNWDRYIALVRRTNRLRYPYSRNFKLLLKHTNWWVDDFDQSAYSISYDYVEEIKEHDDREFKAGWSAKDKEAAEKELATELEDPLDEESDNSNLSLEERKAQWQNYDDLMERIAAEEERDLIERRDHPNRFI